MEWKLQDELSVAPEKFDSEDVVDKCDDRVVSTCVHSIMG